MTLVASDVSDWRIEIGGFWYDLCDLCIVTGGFWYEWLMLFMYLHWWFLIWLIDVIDVVELVVPDQELADMADWCCETGGFWYDPVTYIYPQIVGMVHPISTYTFYFNMLSKLLAAYIQ